MRKETDYAIQMLKLLSKNRNKSLSLRWVAKKLGVSFLFLQKIARKMRLSKLVSAEKGMDGGYKIIINPKNTSIKDVIEKIEGKCCLMSCMDKKNKSKCSCSCQNKCALKNKFKKINDKLLKILNEIKLADI
jgi:Rrf2 family nitric oxide-sensitive transcriptional repressor